MDPTYFFVLSLLFFLPTKQVHYLIFIQTSIHSFLTFPPYQTYSNSIYFKARVKEVQELDEIFLY